MKSCRITMAIDSVCKKYGIPFQSCNPSMVLLYEDAHKLRSIYLRLKEMIHTIKEIEERHNTNLHNSFELLINEIEQADADVIKLARQMKEEK